MLRATQRPVNTDHNIAASGAHPATSTSPGSTKADALVPYPQCTIDLAVFLTNATQTSQQKETDPRATHWTLPLRTQYKSHRQHSNPQLQRSSSFHCNQPHNYLHSKHRNNGRPGRTHKEEIESRAARGQNPRDADAPRQADSAGA